MTILDQIKAGRLVVVPREAEQRMLEAAGRYADGCAIHNYGAPPDADGTWDAMLAASPDHTAGLIALVEGMERERDCAVEDRRLSYNLQAAAVRQRDAAIAEREEAWATVLEVQGHADSWRDRALAAEAERKALREALVLAAEDFRTIKTLNSHGASDQTYIGWLRSNAEQGERRARALTEKNNG